MSEKKKNKDLISQRFWENVSIALLIQRRSYVWLELNAGIPNNVSRSSKSGGHSVRLSMALRIARVLGIELERLISCEYQLKEVIQ